MSKTALSSAERQRKRLDALNEIAKAQGFNTWRRLETAVLKGKLSFRRKRKDSAQKAN